MSVTVKKSSLKWIVIGLIAVLSLSFAIGSIIQKKINEKREAKELEEYIEKTISREYKDLIRDYESYKETMEDYDYSYDLRSRYRRKINELVGENILTNNYISDEDDRTIREKLHSVARINAYTKLLGDD